MSRVIGDKDYYLQSEKDREQLPWRWLSPEALTDFKFTTKSDIWAFGVLLYEVWIRLFFPDLISLFKLFNQGNVEPYNNLTTENCIEYVKSGGTLQIDRTWPPKIQEVMKKCFLFNPNERPSFSSILSFLKSNNDNPKYWNFEWGSEQK